MKVRVSKRPGKPVSPRRFAHHQFQAVAPGLIQEVSAMRHGSASAHTASLSASAGASFASRKTRQG